jgi:4-amino-4-deoxy-L-arabinose transferase-like glycosyltransferase
MSSLLLALPILAGIGLYAVFTDDPARRGKADWRDAFLSASVAWGAIAALSAELLSPFHFITPLGLAIIWAAVIGACLLVGARSRRLRMAWGSLRSLHPSLTLSERWFLFGTVAVVLLLLLIAWVSPPNNVDSLLYHMARVAHWVQDGSLNHFPAGYEHQLTKPTWAETAILHLRVLFGHDKPANLVQWFSMLASLVGASAIAGQLGGSRRAQLLASVLVVSIPMGILQATSTQNDYAVALWAICLAYFVLKRRQEETSRRAVLFIGLSAGLGMLTKGTGYIYSLPFLLWAFWPQRPWKLSVWVREAVAVGLLIGVLNAGFWIRNMITFGGPFGTSEWLSSNLTLGRALVAPANPEEVPTPGGEAVTEPTPLPREGTNAEQDGQPGILSRVEGVAIDLPRRLLQITAYQLVTPFGVITRRYATVLEAFPGVFPVEQTDRIRRLEWNHEDFAPSPVHMVLAGVAIAGAWFLRPKARWVGLRAFAAAVALTYLLLPVVIGHGASVWGIRYVLPFFVLSAPVIALVVAQAISGRLLAVTNCGLIGLSLPWVLLNNTRPLLTDLPYTTRVESILVADRTELLLANLQRQQDAYWNAATLVETLGCRNVGLRLPGYAPEYPF